MLVTPYLNRSPKSPPKPLGRRFGRRFGRRKVTLLPDKKCETNAKIPYRAKSILGVKNKVMLTLRLFSKNPLDQSQQIILFINQETSRSI